MRASKEIPELQNDLAEARAFFAKRRTTNLKPTDATAPAAPVAASTGVQ